MEKKKLNPILLIAAICLVTLAVLSLIVELAYPRSAMMALTALSRPGLNSQQFTPPTGQGGTFNNGGPGMGGGGTFFGTPEAGRQGQFNQNGQTGINPNRQFGNNGLSAFSWLLPAGLGLFVLLAIISAIFLVLKKKWAGILALVLAFLTLIVNALAIYSQFGLARFMRLGNQGNLAFTIIETVLAVAVIVLLLLPKSRALWAVNASKSISSKEDDDDFDDDDDDSDEAIHPHQAVESSAEAAKSQPQISGKKSNPVNTSSLEQSSRSSAQAEDDDEDD